MNIKIAKAHRTLSFEKQATIYRHRYRGEGSALQGNTITDTTYHFLSGTGLILVGKLRLKKSRIQNLLDERNAEVIFIN